MEIQSINGPQEQPKVQNEGLEIAEHEETAEFDRAEYLRNCQDLAKEYLDNPGFARVFEIAVADGSLTQQEFDTWNQAEGLEKHKLLSALSRKINPRKTAAGGTIERAQLDEGKSLPEQLNEATLALGESMDLDKPVEVPAGHYKAFIVHGGINQTPLLRVKFALDSITPDTPWDKLKNIHDLPQEEYQTLLEQVKSSDESGKEFGRSAEIMVLCGCARPLTPGNPEKNIASEAETVANYAPNATIEYDLMNGAADTWLKEKGLADVAADFQELTGTSQAGRLSGSPYAMRVYDLTPAKRDGRLGQNYPDAILSLNAPYDPTQKMQGVESPNAAMWNDRAGTSDILTMLTEVVDFEAGDTVASISHRPVSQGQRLATLNKMMRLGVAVEEGGFNSLPLFKSIRWTEACKIASEAAKVYAQAEALLNETEDISGLAAAENSQQQEERGASWPSAVILSSLGRRAMDAIRRLRSARKEPRT